MVCAQLARERESHYTPRNPRATIDNSAGAWFPYLVAGLPHLRGLAIVLVKYAMNRRTCALRAATEVKLPGLTGLRTSIVNQRSTSFIHGACSGVSWTRWCATDHRETPPSATSRKVLGNV